MQQRTVRRTAMRGFVVVVLARLPLAPASAASVGQATQSKVPFVPSDCPIGAVEGVRIDCGYLTVAESRRPFTGKTIELAVAIVRSPNPAPAPDPVLFLAGGPGQGAVSLAAIIPEVFSATLAHRDI